MFVRIATFLVENVVAFFVILLLLRFHFQWLRVGFRNPFGQFVIALTDWAVQPARRLIPGLAGLDLATLVSAWLLRALGLWVYTNLVGSELGAAAIVGLALVDLLRYSVYILIVAVFVEVVLSWVNPEAPTAPLVRAMTRPFLRPLRRFVPLVGNVDVSPMILLLILWVLLFVIDELARLAGRL
jgi:YggT family protein